MKKSFLSIMTIACALFMVSCGGKKAADAEGANAETTEQTAADEQNSAKFTGDTYSIEAVEYYIKNYKLKLADIEPSFSYDKQKSGCFNGGAGGVDIVFCPTDGAFNPDMMIEAVKKIYPATQAVADGGKIIVGWEDVDTKEAALKERSMEEVLKGVEIMGMKVDQYTWAWQEDGRFCRCNIEEAENLKTGETMGYKVSIYRGLEQSMDDQLEEAAQVLEEMEKK